MKFTIDSAQAPARKGSTNFFATKQHANGLNEGSGSDEGGEDVVLISMDKDGHEPSEEEEKYFTFEQNPIQHLHNVDLGQSIDFFKQIVNINTGF